MSRTGRERGVTVAICCHNGASRLPESLRHLARQLNPRGIPWEVLVVDNASTDGTGEVARRSWNSACEAPLRVVVEERVGLQNARECARRNARFGYLSLVDDDNWVCEHWIDAAAAALDERPDAGACGGPSTAEFEAPPPAWFSRFAGSFAVGTQWATDPGSAEARPMIWGAGLTLRLEAWDRLVDSGFRTILADRTGNSLDSAGDTELCLALRLAGWKVYYDPRLKLRHFMPVGRLRWEYLRRLHRGFGGSLTDAYWYALREGVGNCPEFKRRWAWVVLRQAWYWLRAWFQLPGRRDAPRLEGDERVLRYESQAGRLHALWRKRGTYDAMTRALNVAPWIDRRVYPS